MLALTNQTLNKSEEER